MLLLLALLDATGLSRSIQALVVLLVVAVAYGLTTTREQRASRAFLVVTVGAFVLVALATVLPEPFDYVAFALALLWYLPGWYVLRKRSGRAGVSS